MKSSIRLTTLGAPCLLALATALSACKTTETVTNEITMEPAADSKLESILDSQVRRHEKLCEEYPMRADLRFKLAELHFKKESWRDAERELRAALELVPRDVKYLYHLGRIHLRMGEHEEAEEAFATAVEAAGKRRYSGLFSALGFTRTLLKKWDEAAKDFEACIEIDSSDPQPFYFLGSIADIRNDRERCVRYLREYIERGGRLYRSRAVEILAFNGVVVDASSRTQQAAIEEGIGTSGLRTDRPLDAVLPGSLPGTSELTPATKGKD